MSAISAFVVVVVEGRGPVVQELEAVLCSPRDEEEHAASSRDEIRSRRPVLKSCESVVVIT